ncbi:BC1881 family protein [Paenibacillus sp. UMB7766-LJ446]|uniref:BC1881 family protein n=1 Tax=Paenibacillus sp. UMB7766-LJ446 TaxID=3046313 RepID=UPI00254D40B3|nr:BC1881 family protein [Paenibacillus sp. UMB7766-LJ446]MDK8188982.1 BC1881 family protein [Paenibacillus sp. UMB7766-LJ446]
MDLSKVSTKALSAELEKREGVRKIALTPEAKASLTGLFDLPVSIEGPATILINHD